MRAQIKIMKKNILLLFTLVIFFSGCGKESSPPENVSVTIQKNTPEKKSKSINFSEEEKSQTETEENF